MRHASRRAKLLGAGLTCATLFGCTGAPIEAAAPSTGPASTPASKRASTPAPAATTSTLVDAAAVSAVATRVDPPVAATAVDPVTLVNGLDYGWTEMHAPMVAYRAVALARGWEPATVDLWTPFVWDVIAKESGGCPNTRGGDVFVVGSCTELVVTGGRPDSGFGQVTPVLYGRSGVLCTQEGLCSQHQIISSPWASMVALVATLEVLGRFPWCDYEGAPAYHHCDLIPAAARP